MFTVLRPIGCTEQFVFTTINERNIEARLRLCVHICGVTFFMNYRKLAFKEHNVSMPQTPFALLTNKICYSFAVLKRDGQRVRLWASHATVKTEKSSRLFITCINRQRANAMLLTAGWEGHCCVT